MLGTWGFVRPLTRRLHDAIIAAIGAAVAVMWQQFSVGKNQDLKKQFCPVSHELNMISFVRLSMRPSQRFYKLKPITSTIEMTWHLECGRDFQEIVKKYRSLADGPQRIQKERTMGRDAGYCYALVAHLLYNVGKLVLWSAEMRNFSAEACGKAIRGNLRNVPLLIFCKLPLDNLPHSAIRKISTISEGGLV